MHDRNPCQPSPRRSREPTDWPLLVPAVVVVIGLLALAVYIAARWQEISPSVF